MAIGEQWSSRDLERPFRTAPFERVVLQPPKMSAVLTQVQPGAGSIFKDAYMLEFLSLPEDHSEADLQRDLLEKLKAFLIEFGRDFCFVGAEFPVQVGGRDFQQERRGGGVRAQPQRVPGLDRRVPDAVARQSLAAGQVARVLPAGRERRRRGMTFRW